MTITEYVPLAETETDAVFAPFDHAYVLTFAGAMPLTVSSADSLPQMLVFPEIANESCSATTTLVEACAIHPLLLVTVTA